MSQIPKLVLFFAIVMGCDARDDPGEVHDITSLDFFELPVARGEMLDGVSRWHEWDCLPGFQLGGSKRVYSIELPGDGALAAEIEVESGGNFAVLIARPPADIGEQPQCIAGDASRASAESLPAGEYWVVVDGESSSAHDEAKFNISIEPEVYGQWIHREVGPGVTWRRLYEHDPSLVVNVLDIAPEGRAAGLTAHGVIGDGGCETLPSMGSRSGALAGINTSFFVRDGLEEGHARDCYPITMVKIAGEVLFENVHVPSGSMALGFDADGVPQLRVIPGDDHWGSVEHANGGAPVLLPRGALEARVDLHVFSPRTAAGLTTDGHLLLVTVDGRTSMGLGSTLGGMQDLMEDLGSANAVNFDGGGSTTMWIAGATLSGVVNYPSDGWAGAKPPDHAHSRKISDGLMVFAPGSTGH